MLTFILFFSTGLFLGAFGTLIGAGGGFLLVPLLLFLFPSASPAQITAASLFCVAVNAFSGSSAYIIRRRVHFISAGLFTIFSFPGVWLGTELNNQSNRHFFEPIFAMFLAALAIYLFMKKRAKSDTTVLANNFNPSARGLVFGCFISLFVGFLAGYLGIGGGIIHVPLLVDMIGFPAHLATGTSHLILACSAILGVIGHHHRGSFSQNPIPLLPIALGMAVGAQIGALISKHTSANFIMKALGFALLLVAIRLFIGIY